ncbi:unnamed protein product [Soboliphyme baturini]|uniref:Protein kinase domain-containing protein n=1 Tax=Soboliphyme baturini TaxID=241478 RepID=A0A183J8X0_9BILA|nr:unnamed protein product [Soboliphyme baturini]
MTGLGFTSNGGDTTSVLNKESIAKTLQAVENSQQQDFIQCCLNKDPARRPTVHDLLFHPILFEVPSLKLLAAHVVVNIYESPNDTDERIKELDKNKVIAETFLYDGSPGTQITVGDVPVSELDKYLEDVRNGIYPLTAYANPYKRTRVSSSSTVSSLNLSFPAKQPAASSGDMPSSDNSDEQCIESRRLISMSAEIKGVETESVYGVSISFCSCTR